MQQHKTEYSTVKFDDSSEAKDRIYDMMLVFFKKHDAYDGDTIHQSDGPQIDATTILTKVAEKGFRFDETHNDD